MNIQGPGTPDRKPVMTVQIADKDRKSNREHARQVARNQRAQDQNQNQIPRQINFN